MKFLTICVVSLEVFSITQPARAVDGAVVKLSIIASGSPGMATPQSPLARGNDGWTISVKTGAKIPFPKPASDFIEDVLDDTTLTESEYYFRQVRRRDSSFVPVKLTIDGPTDISIYCLYLFAPDSIEFVRHAGAKAPHITIIAGEPVSFNDVDNGSCGSCQGSRGMHEFTGNLTSISPTPYPNGTGTFEFWTTARGAVELSGSAWGADVSSGGNGGNGGSLTITTSSDEPASTLNFNAAGGSCGRTISDWSSFESTFTIVPAANGSTGGIGGSLSANELKSLIFIGTGGHGGGGEDGFLDVSRKRLTLGGNGGKGGDGGSVAVNHFAGAFQANLRAGGGGDGGRGGNGGIVSGQQIDGVKGGDGGLGGKGGTIAGDVRTIMEAGVSGVVYGSTGGDGGDGAVGGSATFTGGSGGVGGRGGNGGKGYEGQIGGNGGDGGTGGMGSSERASGGNGGNGGPGGEPGSVSQGGLRGTGGNTAQNGMPGPPGHEENGTDLTLLTSPGKSGWTFMAFLAGDDATPGFFPEANTKLEYVTALMLDSMENGLVNDPNLRVAVHYDRYTGANSIFFDRPIPGSAAWGDDWGIARRGIIPWDNLFGIIPTVLPTLTFENTGDPTTIAEFTQWARNAAPATNTALYLLGHGGGWRGILYDDNDGLVKDHLDLKELSPALSVAPAPDMVLLDACVAATIEWATEFMGKTPYLVAPMGVTHGDHHSAGAWMFGGRGADGLGMARSAVARYSADHDFSLMLLDLMPNLITAMRNFVTKSETLSEAEWGTIDTIRRNLPIIDSRVSERDLGTFLNQIQAQVPGLRTEALAALDALTMVLDGGAGGRMGIVLPPRVAAAEASYIGDNVTFCRLTGWDRFVRGEGRGQCTFVESEDVPGTTFGLTGTEVHVFDGAPFTIWGELSTVNDVDIYTFDSLTDVTVSVASLSRRLEAAVVTTQGFALATVTAGTGGAPGVSRIVSPGTRCIVRVTRKSAGTDPVNVPYRLVIQSAPSLLATGEILHPILYLNSSDVAAHAGAFALSFTNTGPVPIDITNLTTGASNRLFFDNQFPMPFTVYPGMALNLNFAIDPYQSGAWSQTVTLQTSIGAKDFQVNVDNPVPPAGTPRLRANPNGIISWPRNATGYVLETAAKISDPNGWQPVTDLLLQDLAEYFVVTQPTGTNRFYRLRRQSP